MYKYEGLCTPLQLPNAHMYILMERGMASSSPEANKAVQAKTFGIPDNESCIYMVHA